jgi:predicted ATPase/DNA-binding winged helix-turn-helix (wHTH) protein
MAQAYRFGTVEVRPDERQLLVKGEPAAVGARAFDLLLTLIDRRDRVVSKNELLELVWPGLIVEENNLQVQVSTLRKLLGNQSIATLPGRGYRFTLPIEGEPGPSVPLPAVRHNLPGELNSFIGRESEIGELKEALVNARLVTLSGAGGTGKSRLATHVASQITDDYPDGVWLVDLAAISDEQRVAQTAAHVLGVKEEPGRPVAEALGKFVQGKRLLLLLDNCEHVIGACADLSRRLLTSAAGVKILATSREPLHVTGEVRFPVPALALETEAVQLFVERAAAVQPSFALTPANAPTVQGICKRLDGIPLSIELAAARAGALTVDRIAVLLNDVFRVLTQGDRTAPTRQQTLRASIDWSYELLSVAERMLLRRLAVFAGGWTVEAAEAVVAEGEIAVDDVVELLTQLVEKSLVDIDERGERYRLLETVRQYAHELADKSGELDRLRARHLEYFAQLAAKARAGSRTGQQAFWHARLDADLDNILAALAACEAQPDGAPRGVELSTNLRHYWIRGGHLALGIRMTRQALGRLPPHERTSTRAAALFDMGQLHNFAGQPAQAKPYLEESIAIARELGDRAYVGFGLQMLAKAFVGLGQIAQAEACLQECVEIARERGDSNELAAALNALGQTHRVEGKLDKAEPLFQQALTLSSQTGNDYAMLLTLLNLAMVWIERGASPRARPVLAEILAEIEEGGATLAAQSALEVSAGLAALLQDWRMTARFYGAAEALAQKTGGGRGPADESFLLRRVDEARRRLEPAAFESFEAEGRALGVDAAVREARAWVDSRS